MGGASSGPPRKHHVDVPRLRQLLAEGKLVREAAEELGMTRAALFNWLKTYEKFNGRMARRGRGRVLIAADQDEGWLDTRGEKCRCGLRLPCNECLPGIDHFASRRHAA